ncbi:hypothetical protein LguiA_014080 [Lonicera macranthoides]
MAMQSIYGGLVTLQALIASVILLIKAECYKMAAEVGYCGIMFSLYVFIIIGLVAFAGLMARLTVGLMSFDLINLEVLIKSNNSQDRIHAWN